MTGHNDFGPFRQRGVLTMGRFKYGDDLTRDVLTMEGRFDWGRCDFGTFRRRDVLTVGRFDCKAKCIAVLFTMRTLKLNIILLAMQLHHYFQYVPLIDYGYTFKCIAPLLPMHTLKLSTSETS